MPVTCFLLHVGICAVLTTVLWDLYLRRAYFIEEEAKAKMWNNLPKATEVESNGTGIGTQEAWFQNQCLKSPILPQKGSVSLSDSCLEFQS